MPPEILKSLSRRERQIIDALYMLESASVQQVLDAIDDPPSYSSVRALLNRMVDKKLINYRRDGSKYLYFPLADRADAADSAIERLLTTFFSGSAVDAVTALLGAKKDELTEAQLNSLQEKLQRMKDKQD